jgi:hypothetical protein
MLEEHAIISLCHSELDFGLKATWNLFRTSHEKCPCDGIRSVVKSMTAKASVLDKGVLILQQLL